MAFNMGFDLEKALRTVNGVKLQGGVVGKVSLVLVTASICIGGMAAYSGNEWILGGGIAAIFLLVFSMLWRLINFADRNPQAALLEGAEFLLHQRILMGTKANPSIPLEIEALTEERHEELPPGEKILLDKPDEVPALPTVVPNRWRGAVMAELFHIYISPRKNATQEDVEKKLNLAVDWYRYTKGVYIVYTTSSSAKWKARLSNLVKPDGLLFICKLDTSTREGWMTKAFGNG